MCGGPHFQRECPNVRVQDSDTGADSGRGGCNGGSGRAGGKATADRAEAMAELDSIERASRPVLRHGA